MKKRIITVFLSLTFAASILLTGCSGGTESTSTKEAASEAEEEVREPEEETQDQEKTDAGSETQKEDKEEIGKKADAEAGNEAEDKNEEEEEIIEATRGTVEDGMFVNETFGLAFAITDDMTVFSDEQMFEALGIGSDIMTEDGVATAEQIEQALQGTMYDIMIMFSDNTSNVSVTYDNMDITCKGIHFDEEQYGQMLINMLGQMSSVQYEVVSEDTVELAGKEYYRLKLSADYGGAILEQTYLCRRQDNYMVGIIISGQEGSPFEEEFLNSFVDPASVSGTEE